MDGPVGHDGPAPESPDPDLWNQDILRRDFLRLSHDAMREVGPAAQTLAVFYGLKSERVYLGVEGIAELACLPEETCRKHLRILCMAGFLQNAGRELLGDSKFRRRRTNTYQITPKTKAAAGKFGRLPRWAARLLDSWAERAVFACILSRCLLSVDKQLSAHGRLSYSVTKLEQETGLTRPSVIKAKQGLQTRGVIVVERAANNGGALNDADWLWLNLSFRVARDLRTPRVGSKKMVTGWLKNGQRGSKKMVTGWLKNGQPLELDSEEDTGIRKVRETFAGRMTPTAAIVSEEKTGNANPCEASTQRSSPEEILAALQRMADEERGVQELSRA